LGDNPSPAQRLSAALEGRYRVTRELGAGGMATVYLAHDLKHERDVAIKVLHPDLGAALGGERFLTEIRTTARLQHPHILPLLDSGEADGLLYYVMPLVTGETLRARLERERQLPIADAVRLAREIASALDYAHRQNVIHRDIKPENVLLHDGSALVADFGIALAVQTAGGQRMTQTGLSLGTPQYMSPEQAMGERTIDARSDIYALGAVTYEMLVGEAPFIGNSVQAIVARVLTEEPRSIGVQRKSVPEGVEQAVLRALEKLPADRFESAKEFIDALGRDGQPISARAAVGVAPPRLSRVALAIMAVLALTTSVAAAGWWRAIRQDGARAVTPVQFTIEAPDGATITAPYQSLDMSSAVQRVAFLAKDSAGIARIYVRALGDVRALRLQGTEGATQLFFSPDGAWIAFTANSRLKKIPSIGGTVEDLADVRIPRGGSWGVNGFIYLADAGRIVVVPENGGIAKTLRPLTEVGRLTQSPVILPDGETLLFTDWAGTSSNSRLMAYAIATDSVSPLGVGGSRVLGVVDGWLLYGDERGALAGVPYDAKQRAVVGEPQRLSAEPSSDQAILVAALGADGSLLFRTGATRNALTLLTPGGTLDVLADALEAAVEPRISPDGLRIMAASGSAATEVLDFALTTRSLTRAASGQSSGLRFGRPEWTPDGARRLFRTQTGTDRSVFMWQAVDGRGTMDTLHSDAKNSVWEAVVSPNGRYLLFRLGTNSTADLRYRLLVGDTTSRPFVATAAAEQEGRFSPDGRWVVYASDEAGSGLNVYVRAFPDGVTSYRISESGGQQPVWARDGKSVYYVPSDGMLVRARVDVASAFRVIARDTLVRSGFELPAFRGHAMYDVMPDGRLVLTRPLEAGQRLVVSTGWFAAWREKSAKAAK
jgi:eukaryotic-like serine/threonine-protein kinase